MASGSERYGGLRDIALASPNSSHVQPEYGGVRPCYEYEETVQAQEQVAPTRGERESAKGRKRERSLEEDQSRRNSHFLGFFAFSPFRVFAFSSAGLLIRLSHRETSEALCH